MRGEGCRYTCESYHQNDVAIPSVAKYSMFRTDEPYAECNHDGLINLALKCCIFSNLLGWFLWGWNCVDLCFTNLPTRVCVGGGGGFVEAMID